MNTNHMSGDGAGKEAERPATDIETLLAPDAVLLRFSRLEAMYADLERVKVLLAKYTQLLDDWR